MANNDLFTPESRETVIDILSRYSVAKQVQVALKEKDFNSLNSLAHLKDQLISDERLKLEEKSDTELCNLLIASKPY